MKHVDEYRDAETVRRLLSQIHAATTRPWTLMEVCGGQTHAIVKHGLEQLLPDALTLVHGPGCPVCVTPVEQLDRALQIAGRPEVIFCSYGDMVRVPGSDLDLLSARAQGADVRVVYSPLDALALARAHPHKQVVFFAVGFETTAPAHALAVQTALEQRVDNFSLLLSQVCVPPAMEHILSAPGNCVQAFLAAGHVCTVMGTLAYGALSQRYGVPIVVTGFEPVDVLHGVLLAVQQLEQGVARVENAYARAVRPDGNVAARALIERVFTEGDRAWRGLGVLPRSGLTFAPAYQRFDAEQRFNVRQVQAREHPECIAAMVLQGRRKPTDCPAFAAACRPERPLGAPMVSSEGACAAYYRFRPLATARGAS